MNILILTHSYPDPEQRWRGVFVQEQARALSRKHNVTVVYFKADYSRFAPFTKYSYVKSFDGTMPVYEVTVKKSFPVITQLKLLSGTCSFIRKEILAKQKIDIIHSHLSYPGGFLGTIIQSTLKIPDVLTEHSTLRLYNRSFIHKLCVGWTLKNSSGVISVSSSLKEEIAKIRKREIKVIPNIVNSGLFETRRLTDIKKLNIGFLGALNNNNKGLDILIEACSGLDAGTFNLHIGGTGKLTDHYKALAKEHGIESNCIFHGEIIRSRIADFYSNLDIFVLPSRYETFGIVLIEAMACGIPVIATKCGGPLDIVTESTGLLIEKDNRDELANAIVRMADNMKFYNSETIRNYAREKFGEETIARQITGFYKEILALK
jgi:glycosyltransferase involved in cell wall biosynthesis